MSLSEIYNNNFNAELARAIAMSQKECLRNKETGSCKRKRTVIDMDKNPTEEKNQGTEKRQKNQSGKHPHLGLKYVKEWLEIPGGPRVSIAIPRLRKVTAESLLSFMSSKQNKSEFLIGTVHNKTFQHDPEKYLGEEKIKLMRMGQWTSEMQAFHSQLQELVTWVLSEDYQRLLISNNRNSSKEGDLSTISEELNSLPNVPPAIR